MNFSKRLLSVSYYDNRLQCLPSIFSRNFFLFGGTTDVNGDAVSIKKLLTRSITSLPHKKTENEASPIQKSLVEKELSRKTKISKAMKAYLQRSLDHDKFMKEKFTEYEIGKRHLANMMGENPETFTQDDINNAITYLLPSGLFEPLARPVMKHPQELFPKKKDAEFDMTGRPFHTLFYTGRPTFYSLLQQISIKALELDNMLNKMNKIPTDQKLTTDGTKWIVKEKFEEMLLEKIPEEMFEHFTRSLERLLDHPLAFKEQQFIMTYRNPVENVSFEKDIYELMYKEDGTPYVKTSGKRRTATADATVYGNGTGKITINGDDIRYFDVIQDRMQVMFPLQFTGLMKSVDIEATVAGGTKCQEKVKAFNIVRKSGQAGALRYAISVALRSFVDPVMTEKMRIAGLLTKDARRKERKKPGQRRARAKFTWKKR